MAAVEVQGAPLTIAVPRAAEILGISRRHAYALAESGELKTLRLGKSVRVLTAPLMAMIDEAVDAQTPEAA